MWQEVWRDEYQADETGPAGIVVGLSDGVRPGVRTWVYRDDDGHWYWEHQGAAGHKGTGTSQADCIRQAKDDLHTYTPVYF